MLLGDLAVIERNQGRMRECCLRASCEARRGQIRKNGRCFPTAAEDGQAIVALGELSPRRAAHAVETAAAADSAIARSAEKYLAELGWRDFAAALLYSWRDLARRPLRPEFEHFPFREDEQAFRAWARGETGYPVVDAGMRQLWGTGFIHNRARMIAASLPSSTC